MNKEPKAPEQARQGGRGVIKLKGGARSASGQGEMRKVVPSRVRNPRKFLLLTVGADEARRVRNSEGADGPHISEEGFVDFLWYETGRKRQIRVQRLGKLITFGLVEVSRDGWWRGVGRAGDKDRMLEVKRLQNCDRKRKVGPLNVMDAKPFKRFDRLIIGARRILFEIVVEDGTRRGVIIDLGVE